MAPPTPDNPSEHAACDQGSKEPRATWHVVVGRRSERTDSTSWRSAGPTCANEPLTRLKCRTRFAKSCRPRRDSAVVRAPTNVTSQWLAAVMTCSKAITASEDMWAGEAGTSSARWPNSWRTPRSYGRR